MPLRRSTLVGTVLETPHALDVYAHLVDVETSVILAAEDVYGEDLGLPTVKTLMEGQLETAAALSAGGGGY